MRRILLTTAAFAFSAGMAMAADTANIDINATQEPLCDITAVSSDISLAGVDVPVAGTFEYECNFVGNPSLNFTSQNGGVVTGDNGGGEADYGIWLNDVAPIGAPSGWLQASNTPQSYGAITASTTANDTVIPFFSVGLSEPLPVAGNYTDILTVDIAP